VEEEGREAVDRGKCHVLADLIVGNHEERARELHRDGKHEAQARDTDVREQDGRAGSVGSEWYRRGAAPRERDAARKRREDGHTQRRAGHRRDEDCEAVGMGGGKRKRKQREV